MIIEELKLKMTNVLNGLCHQIDVEVLGSKYTWARSAEILYQMIISRESNGGRFLCKKW